MRLRGIEKQNRLDSLLSFILIISIIVSISVTIYVIVTPKQGERFTEFYILGPNGTASDYPTVLKQGEPGKVIIGIVNHEYDTVLYRLVVRFDNSTIEDRTVELSNNETWEHPFSFRPDRTGRHQKLEFLLYKQDDDVVVYRSLHLWVDVVQ